MVVYSYVEIPLQSDPLLHLPLPVIWWSMAVSRQEILGLARARLLKWAGLYQLENSTERTQWNHLLFGREFCQHFPVTITLAVFADKDSFLLKAYSEPFYCGDGFPDCLLQVFLGDTRILCDGF